MRGPEFWNLRPFFVDHLVEESHYGGYLLFLLFNPPQFVADHAGKIIGHGDFLDLILPGIDLCCNPVGKLPAGFHKGLHFRQFVAGDLKAGNSFAKDFPLRTLGN